jgi:hypothetical protein
VDKPRWWQKVDPVDATLVAGAVAALVVLILVARTIVFHVTCGLIFMLVAAYTARAEAPERA